VLANDEGVICGLQTDRNRRRSTQLG